VVAIGVSLSQFPRYGRILSHRKALQIIIGPTIVILWCWTV
jgi:hypothetical protein